MLGFGPRIRLHPLHGSGNAFGTYKYLLIGYELTIVFCHSLRQRRVFPMPSPNSLVLQQLDRLNRSSSGFRDQLRDLLDGEEYRKCVQNLQPDDLDLVWLLEYLDKVCHRVTLPTLRSGQRRFSVVWILIATRHGSVCTDSVAYAAPYKCYQHRTRCHPIA